MGGGDLNLKKSWHPSTFKNQERVWKAEQEKAHEDKKIAELQRELREERAHEELVKIGENAGTLKKESKDLNWMYKGPGHHVSREEYLLGRKIDKSLEILEKEETEEKEKHVSTTNKSSYTVEHEINPESVISKDKSSVQVDMKRKLLEDPLLMIRQNEEATKRSITSNPVKMKQLQLLINSLKEKRKKKKKHKKSEGHKKKKSKKTKKHKKSDSTKKKKKKKESGSKDRAHSSDSSSSSSESENEEASRRRKVMELIAKETKRAALRRASSLQDDVNNGHGNRQEEKERDRETKRQSSADKGDRRKSRRSRSTSRTRTYSSGGTRPQSSNRSKDKHRSRSRSRSKDKHRSRSRSRSKVKQDERKKNGDKEEEMKKKREEMMAAAAERDAQRKKNVQRYKEEQKMEEKDENNAQEFLRDIGDVSVGTSVESRIRSKAGYSQRSSDLMNSNFLRK